MRSDSYKEGNTEREFMQKEKRAFYFSLAIVISFIVAYIPLIAAEVSEMTSNALKDELQIAANFCLTLNTITDGVIYISKRDIRQEYLKIFCGRKHISKRDSSTQRT